MAIPGGTSASSRRRRSPAPGSSAGRGVPGRQSALPGLHRRAARPDGRGVDAAVPRLLRAGRPRSRPGGARPGRRPAPRRPASGPRSGARRVPARPGPSSPGATSPARPRTPAEGRGPLAFYNIPEPASAAIEVDIPGMGSDPQRPPDAEVSGLGGSPRRPGDLRPARHRSGRSGGSTRTRTSSAATATPPTATGPGTSTSGSSSSCRRTRSSSRWSSTAGAAITGSPSRAIGTGRSPSSRAGGR